MAVEISCIVPVKNGEKYIRECLLSLLHQRCCSVIYEICVYDDGSTDGTFEILNEFEIIFGKSANIPFRFQRGEISCGVGHAKNGAIGLSHGKFLCFCDADDINTLNRLQRQYAACLELGEDDCENYIIGSRFSRLPINSTPRYREWACTLGTSELHTQIYTSFGPTVVAPSWFMARSIFEKVGAFNDKYKTGFPEDLDFFYRALREGVKIFRVDEELVIYRHHLNCSTYSVLEHTLWNIRIIELQRNVLAKWQTFTIWNAGKQGKRFFRSLSNENKLKVVAMCDVDERKISNGRFEVFDERTRQITHSVPIIHFRSAKPPAIVCVKLNMTNGSFERNLLENNWREGIDFFHFS